MSVTEIKPSPKDPQEKSKGKQGQLGLHRLIPNLLTLMALAAGLTAIQVALEGNWERAVIAILIAAILDALDGAVARLLNATSDFGAELDSLSDFLAFGIAPAVILYTWILEDAGKIGWIAMLVYAAATALRLARFNVMRDTVRPDWKRGFFSGVPAPAGAGLALLPLIIWLQFPQFFEQFAFATPFAGLWVIFVAALMVSRIPTWSSKQIKIPAKMGMPALAFGALMIAALIQAPWQTLSLSALIYMVSIPFAIRHFLRLQARYEDAEDLTDLALGTLSFEELSDRKARQKARKERKET